MSFICHIAYRRRSPGGAFALCVGPTSLEECPTLLIWPHSDSLRYFVRACVHIHTHTYRTEQSHSSSVPWRMENQGRRWNDLNIYSLILLSDLSFDLLAIDWQLNLKREQYLSDQYRLSLPAANIVRVGGPHRAYVVYDEWKRDSDICHIK